MTGTSSTSKVFYCELCMKTYPSNVLICSHRHSAPAYPPKKTRKLSRLSKDDFAYMQDVIDDWRIYSGVTGHKAAKAALRRLKLHRKRP